MSEKTHEMDIQLIHSSDDSKKTEPRRFPAQRAGLRVLKKKLKIKALPIADKRL